MIVSGTQRTLQRAALLSELRQIARDFDISIEADENRTHIFDLGNADYPLEARFLRVRRENLLWTISTLETHSPLVGGRVS